MGVMGISVASALSTTYAQNKALQAQGAANVATARNYITSMNYSFQNFEQERRDAYEATIAELERINLQGNRLTSQVDAAVNEGMQGGGRTANLIKRSAQADVNRAVNSAKTNYRLKSNEIDLNKEATALNTRNAIASIQNVSKPSLFTTLLNLGSAYYQARGTLESIDAIRTQAGVDGRGRSAGGTGANLSFTTVNTDLYGTPQKAFDDVLGGATFLGNPTAHFSFSDINPFDYYIPQKGRD